MSVNLHYAQNWLDKATAANNAAEILNNAGRIDEATRLLLVAKYCYRRYQNSIQSQALKHHGTPSGDRLAFYAGAFTALGFIFLLIYCFLKIS